MPYYKSNNTTTHIHHKIPLHMGGKDTPDNLMELSIRDHAEEHKWLFIEHGRVEDACAWLGLYGLMDKETIRKEVIRSAMKRQDVMDNYYKAIANPEMLNRRAKLAATAIRKPETREKMRQAKLGRKLKDETKQKMSRVRKGRPGIKHTEETKRRMSIIAKQREAKKRELKLEMIS